MKPGSKNLVAFGLVLFFGLGVLCSTMAAPGQSLASAAGCSQKSGAMEMTGCELPSYLCGFGSSSYLLSGGVLSSSRVNELTKNTLALAIGEGCIDASNDGALLVGKASERAFPDRPRKVSIRLYHSVLNL